MLFPVEKHMFLDGKHVYTDVKHKFLVRKHKNQFEFETFVVQKRNICKAVMNFCLASLVLFLFYDIFRYETNKNCITKQFLDTLCSMFLFV